MKKKILYLITKSNWGGAQRYVYDLATNLKDRYDVTVVLGGEGLLKKRLEESGVKTMSVPSFERDISLTKEVLASFQMMKIFRVEKPDIVHLNSSKAGGLGALVARLSGVRRVIFTAHGWPFLESRNPLSKSLIYFFSWLTALLADTVIVVSDHDLKIAQKMPFIAHKAIRIYNGIAPMHLGSGDIVRSSFPKGVQITGTIGELNKNKNQIALVDQPKHDTSMYVAIVGDGENREYLKKKIEEYGLGTRVKLFGFMPAHEVLRGLDTFALPSLKEGLPYVLLEAKRAGLPIVANRIGGVSDILDANDMSEFSLARMTEKTRAVYDTPMSS